jgi:hypothetical protein
VINPLAQEDVARLSPEERREVERALASSKFRLWAPTPGPQMDAYFSDADELFYGGAAGGGKTSLIIGLALTAHQRSLVVRKESTQLRGFIDDIARIARTRDGLNKQDGQWRIPASVALAQDQLIEFGGVPNPGDEERHQGIPHDLLAFDEVTQVSEYVVDYLSTWCRTTTPGQRCRVLLTSNPPTPSTSIASSKASMGGLWLIRRYAPWLDPQYRDLLGLGKAAPGELRWFVTLNGREEEWPDPLPFLHEVTAGERKGTTEIIIPRSRTFIPSLPTDNPYLDSAYIANLQKRPEPLRSALLYGDFSVSLTDTPNALFPADWVRSAVARWVALTDTRPAFHRPDRPYRPPNARQTGIGADVARGGADSTIIQLRYGSYFCSPIEIPTTVARTGPEVAGEIIKRRTDESQIVVDANGVGASVYDTLSPTIEGTMAYVGSYKGYLADASGSYGFPTLRSQSYWKLREALDPAAPCPLAIPDDPDLIQELLAHNWAEQSGKIVVTPKEKIQEALKRSPDKADALVLAFVSHQFGDHAGDEDQPRGNAAEAARERRLADARSLDAPQKSPVFDPWSSTTPLSATRSRARASWSSRELPYPKRY